MGNDIVVEVVKFEWVKARVNELFTPWMYFKVWKHVYFLSHCLVPKVSDFIRWPNPTSIYIELKMGEERTEAAGRPKKHQGSACHNESDQLRS